MPDLLRADGEAGQRLGLRPSRKAHAAVSRPTDLPYDQYLKTRHWRETRLKALRKFGGRCEQCGTRPAREVHHLTYEKAWGGTPLRPYARVHSGKHRPASVARRHSARTAGAETRSEE